MANLLEQATTAINASLQARVAMGMYSVAREVIFESPDTESHIHRASFARQVVNSQHSEFLKYAALIVADPSIASAELAENGNNITDKQILAAIRQMWNPLSGVPN